jgi:hypothetical protein
VRSNWKAQNQEIKAQMTIKRGGHTFQGFNKPIRTPNHPKISQKGKRLLHIQRTK